MSNILLDKNGNAKIIDFGSCRHFNSTFIENAVTTPMYSPPELIDRDTFEFIDEPFHYDFTVDFWSFGVYFQV